MAEFEREWLTEMNSIQREMERLLNHYAGSKPPAVQYVKKNWEPAIDVYETANTIHIIVELAGVDEEKVQITAEQSILVIRGARNTPGEGARRSYHQMEIPSGSFERMVPLPVGSDISHATAVYQKGMLIITIPRNSRSSSRGTKVAVIRSRRINNER